MSATRLRTALPAAIILAAAAGASAQPIIPTSQVREVRGHGTWTDPSGTFETGPLLTAASDGDYGLWSDTVFVPGFISGAGTQTGGFNGFDTFSLDSISLSLGGGNGPGTSAAANLEIEFTYTFTLTEAVTYTTSVNVSVAPPSAVPDTLVDFAASYTLTGPGGPVFTHQTAEANGYSINLAGDTGTLQPGSYTLSFVVGGDVSFVAPEGGSGNGAGGGGGGPSPLVLFSVQPTGACPADWDGNGSVNSTDISAYLVSWLNSLQLGDLNADFNNDNAVNSSDISAFLTAWLQAVQGGC